MVGKIRSSLEGHRSRLSSEVRAAGSDLHHLVLGPGSELEHQWVEAGLELPDLDAMLSYRVARTVEQVTKAGYDGALLFDPRNLRYVTDSINMQMWVFHNAAGYAWVGADGSVILWDYLGCEFLSAHNRHVSETRTSVGTDAFVAGGRAAEMAGRLAAEMADVARAAGGKAPRIAIDRINVVTMLALQDAGVEVGNAQELMEEARRIKSADEILAMRCAVHACEAAMDQMRQSLAPGMTERQVLSVLHGANIARAGEWIETQILASGPRMNPWFQEASSRVIENGDVVAYDTDLVGPYGMMVDISRTWIAGDAAPRRRALTAYDLAREQIARNIELLRPGVTYRELTHGAWFRPIDDYRFYSCLFHGVGQCDEVPDIYFPHQWEESGYDGVVETGMGMTVEAYVGARHGGEGVKLEDQVLITDSGPELLTHYPLELAV